MLDLRHENSVEYNRKIKAMAESLGFSVSDYLGFLALIFSGQALCKMSYHISFARKTEKFGFSKSWNK